LKDRGLDPQSTGELKDPGWFGAWRPQVAAKSGDGQIVTDALARSEAVNDGSLDVADDESGALSDVDVDPAKMKC
jgi:hypothetical protein